MPVPATLNLRNNLIGEISLYVVFDGNRNQDGRYGFLFAVYFRPVAFLVEVNLRAVGQCHFILLGQEFTVYLDV